MGGLRFDTEPIKREHVPDAALNFMMCVIPKTDYIIAGSFRRGKAICGDIEIVIPCDDMSQMASVSGCIAKQFGSTQSGTAVTSGRYGCVQFDLFPVRRHQMGAMLLHATGSWQFNKLMRTNASDRGMLLNQYGLFRITGTDRVPLVISDDEADFFKYLGMDYVEPTKR